MRWFLVALLAVTLLGGASHAREDHAARQPFDEGAYYLPASILCTLGDNPDLVILICTRLIESGRYSGSDLAAFYNSRGLAYWELEEWDLANADFAEASRLFPAGNWGKGTR
ncbi:MAG: hypothetical protein AAFX92_03915 [Pseudomonadota bacterium]